MWKCFVILYRYKIRSSNSSVHPVNEWIILASAMYCWRSSQKLTIHFSLLRENDFSSSAWWVDGKCFLETLFDIWTPDSFGISRGQVFLILKICEIFNDEIWISNVYSIYLSVVCRIIYADTTVQLFSPNSYDTVKSVVHWFCDLRQRRKRIWRNK